MRSRSWNCCLTRDAVTGAWCRARPSKGVLCSEHAEEFRADEAAKAATRLQRARLAVWDPSTTPLRRWWARVQIRRARSLRRSLLASAETAEGQEVDYPLASVDLALPENLKTWR